MLWRERILIVKVVLAGLALATVVLPILPRKYSAEAFIQLDFARDESNNSTPGTAGSTPPIVSVAPAVSVDAAALAESEVRLLNSWTIARKVAKRLGL